MGRKRITIKVNLFPTSAEWCFRKAINDGRSVAWIIARLVDEAARMEGVYPGWDAVLPPKGNGRGRSEPREEFDDSFS